MIVNFTWLTIRWYNGFVYKETFYGGSFQRINNIMTINHNRGGGEITEIPIERIYSMNYKVTS
jgi:hypothetical protein